MRHVPASSTSTATRGWWRRMITRKARCDGKCKDKDGAHLCPFWRYGEGGTSTDYCEVEGALEDEDDMDEIKEKEVLETGIKDYLLVNLIATADWHRKHCVDEQCNVSIEGLGMVYQLVAGRDMTEKEKKSFRGW